MSQKRITRSRFLFPSRGFIGGLHFGYCWLGQLTVSLLKKKKKEKSPNSILCLLGLSRIENQILVPPHGSQDCWVQATKMELKAS